MTVYKYPVEINDTFVLTMPAVAKPLHVALRHGSPYVWVAVNPETMDVDHQFQLCGTGHRRTDIAADTHVGSFQEGPFVWHLFYNGHLSKETA